MHADRAPVSRLVDPANCATAAEITGQAEPASSSWNVGGSAPAPSATSLLYSARQLSGDLGYVAPAVFFEA